MKLTFGLKKPAVGKLAFTKGFSMTLLVEFPQRAGEEDVEIHFLEAPKGKGLFLQKRRHSIFPLHLKQGWGTFPENGKWALAAILAGHLVWAIFWAVR